MIVLYYRGFVDSSYRAMLEYVKNYTICLCLAWSFMLCYAAGLLISNHLGSLYFSEWMF